MSQLGELFKTMVVEAASGLDVPDAALTHMVELLSGPFLEEKQSIKALDQSAKHLWGLMESKNQVADS